MGKLTTIFKDTAIYGLSSIVGRFLNYSRRNPSSVVAMV